MSVKSYSLKKDGSKKLSPHFQVREFRCKDGTDKILIESELISVLEQVFDHFDCSKINIVSGYRTAKHDKRVGGKGRGNHVQGKAADFIAYDKNGNKIKSRYIVLYLEDIGVKGIGYRSGGNEYSTHIDVNYRLKKWYGDEKKSMSASIGKSFYGYLGIKYASYMTIANLNIRTKPGLSGKKVDTVRIATMLKVAVNDLKIEADGHIWYKVKYNGRHYYAASGYLKEAGK